MVYDLGKLLCSEWWDRRRLVDRTSQFSQSIAYDAAK